MMVLAYWSLKASVKAVGSTGRICERTSSILGFMRVYIRDSDGKCDLDDIERVCLGRVLRGGIRIMPGIRIGVRGLRALDKVSDQMNCRTHAPTREALVPGEAKP
jgi:hypothetical protein